MAEYERVVRDGKPSDALVFHCSDPDFQVAFREFISTLGINKYDAIVEPGPSKFIVEHPDITARVDKLQSLHHFERAVILDHFDCGAFGISDPELEIAAHFKEAKLAQEVLIHALPSLVVEYHLLGWDREIVDQEPAVTSRPNPARVSITA